MLVKARAGLDFFRVNLEVAHGYFHQRVADERVGALQQQGVNRVGGGLGGFPVLRLLLLEQPHLGFLERLEVLCHLVEGLDHHGLRLDGCAVPPPAVLLVAPEEAHFLVGHGAFLDGFNDELRQLVVVLFFLKPTEAVHRNGNLRLVHA